MKSLSVGSNPTSRTRFKSLTTINFCMGVPSIPELQPYKIEWNSIRRSVEYKPSKSFAEVVKGVAKIAAKYFPELKVARTWMEVRVKDPEMGVGIINLKGMPIGQFNALLDSPYFQELCGDPWSNPIRFVNSKESNYGVDFYIGKIYPWIRRSRPRAIVTMWPDNDITKNKLSKLMEEVGRI